MLVLTVSLDSQSAVLLASGSESSQLSVLVSASGNPVDLSVTSDSLVHWVHHDDFVELVDGVLGHPVAVEYAQTAEFLADSLLCDRA